MTSHSLDSKKKSKKWEAIRCSPLRNSLSGFFGLLSSSAMLVETYNQLGLRFLNRTKNNDQRSQWSLCPYMCRISGSTFVSKFNSQPRLRNSKNRKQSQKNVWLLITIRVNLILDLSNLISWNRLSRENVLTQQQTMTTCLALLVYNYNRQTRSILSILPNPIFKKWQNRHTNTFIPRFSRIILGRKNLH